MRDIDLLRRLIESTTEAVDARPARMDLLEAWEQETANRRAPAGQRLSHLRSRRERHPLWPLAKPPGC